MVAHSVRAPLTERQAEVLAYILEFIDQNGWGPSYREMCRHFRMSLNGMRGHVIALRRKGYIHVDDYKARAIRPTDLASTDSDRPTRCEVNVLIALAQFALTRGEMPTYAELADEFGVDTMTVIGQLRRLRELGFVDWDPAMPRSFRLLSRPDASSVDSN
jgi:SOS-response transcriptional repressor LexA